MTARGFPAFPPAKRRPGHFARTWWGRAWIKAMEDSALDEQQLRQGRKYAYTGYVGSITVSPGRLAATVRDYEDDTSYQTVMRLEPLSDSEWRRFLDQVAAKSGHIAALLDRDMPAELVDAAADAGVRLLPDLGDLDPECSCPGWELPCRHAAALAYQVSWLLDADPFVLLLVRGKDENELLGDLHREPAHAEPASAEPATEVFARQAVALPEPPPIPDAEPAVVSVPAAEGVDPVALEVLATDAARRARLLMAGETVDHAKWPDTVRYAAGYPVIRDRLGVGDLPVAAWETGGALGLAVLETAWTPSKADLARAADSLASASDDVAIVWRNRWTVGEAQLRFGKDGRWYPYRERDGDWWPVGPPQPDPASALISVLA